MSAVLPPSRLKIGHLTYSVSVVPGDDMDGAHADIDHDKATIRLGDHMAPAVMAEKLVHEVLHGCYDAWQINDRWREEKTVEALSPALCAVLRDNPELVKFLNEALG